MAPFIIALTIAISAAPTTVAGLGTVKKGRATKLSVVSCKWSMSFFCMMIISIIPTATVMFTVIAGINKFAVAFFLVFMIVPNVISERLIAFETVESVVVSAEVAANESKSFVLVPLDAAVVVLAVASVVVWVVVLAVAAAVVVLAVASAVVSVVSFVVVAMMASVSVIVTIMTNTWIPVSGRGKTSITTIGRVWVASVSSVLGEGGVSILNDWLARSGIGRDMVWAVRFGDDSFA